MLIGVDIIEIERVKKAVERTPRFLDRVFTSRELVYCMKKANPYPSLAARFAAKEALRKLHPAFIPEYVFMIWKYCRVRTAGLRYTCMERPSIAVG